MEANVQPHNEGQAYASHLSYTNDIVFHFQAPVSPFSTADSREASFANSPLDHAWPRIRPVKSHFTCKSVAIRNPNGTRYSSYCNLPLLEPFVIGGCKKPCDQANLQRNLAGLVSDMTCQASGCIMETFALVL
jgi:hypothetical protein